MKRSLTLAATALTLASSGFHVAVAGGLPSPLADYLKGYMWRDAEDHDHPFRALETYSGKNEGSLVRWTGIGCSPHAPPTSVQDFNLLFAAHCDAKQGVWDAPFCRSVNDSKHALFSAQALQKFSTCRHGVKVVLHAIEPTGAIDDPQYAAAIVEAGFVDGAQLLARQLDRPAFRRHI